MLRFAAAFLCCASTWALFAADDVPSDANRLAYLDECNPWYPHKDFPKLITPQWVGEEGVEAVIVLAIDDMRDPAKYESYLRPILNRLKQIDGRAPVSIMTCDVKPDDAQLQSWLGEGLSIECHTIDHPCPILQGGDLPKAKSTYDRCVDLMDSIPNNMPVAFRTPCCDSLNTVSPRFFSEIVSKTTEKGNFLQIDSSVFTFFTSEDESLPKELVLDANGKERFWKYLPKNNKYGGNTHDNFVNYIKNYPYPYVINNSCWEIPCIAPSDWSAQHLHGINNPVTIEDWKAAIDLTVQKKGCFSLVFHPHGWIKPEQVVEMIDHAVAKHGNKVRFLNFREVAERLNQRFFFSTKEMPQAYSVHSPGDVVRFEDVDDNGFVDVIYSGTGTKMFDGAVLDAPGQILATWDKTRWNIHQFPFVDGQSPFSALFQPSNWSSSIFVFHSAQNGKTTFYQQPELGGFGHGEGHAAQIWRLGDAAPHVPKFDHNTSVDEPNKPGPNDLSFEIFVDIDGDGISEALGRPSDLVPDEHCAVFHQVVQPPMGSAVWETTLLKLPARPPLSEMVFVDIDANGLRDACIIKYGEITVYLTASLDLPWKAPLSFKGQVPGLLRYPCETHNGFFIHDNHFCWINEDTAKLPDLMYRVSFDEVLAAGKKKAESGEQKAEEPDSKSQISNLKSEVNTATYNPIPIGAAVVDITPAYPVRLTGYGNRMKESEGVAARIHARALAIGTPKVAVSLRRDEPSPAPQTSGTPTAAVNDSATGNAASADHANSARLISAERDGYTVLITVDNCGVPLEMTEAVYERVAAKYNIPRQNFAISSTHSHSAPWLRGFAPNIFAEIPEDHAAHLAQYEKDLTDKLVDVVEKAIASQRPGHLSYGFGEAGFAMNRRALANGKWSGFGDVPDGPTDKRVPVLAAHDVEKKLVAVLANYACHCTTETGEFNQISGDWAGFAADMLEADHPGAVALIAIGCGADANPAPRGTHEQAKVHGRTIADEVNRLLAKVAVSLRRDEPLPAPQDAGTPVASAKDSATDNAALADNANTARLISAEQDGYMKSINPDILCNMSRIDLPLGPLPTREEWEQQAKSAGVEGSRARYFLKMLDEGKPIPTTIPNYPVQTWCFGDDLAMVFLGGEVVVDYSIRMNDMFDSDRLWINAYSNDVPCYIASARVLREGGYECDSSMLYYRRPTRLAPEAEDVLCDAVQKIMPHKFYSEKLLQDFPAPKSPEESLKCMTTKPDLRVVLAASEPLIRDPVAFDWDERGRLWVVEMGDYPKGDPKVAVSLRRDEPSTTPQSSGTPVSPTKDLPTDNAALADEANTARLISAERDGYRGRVQMLEDTDKNGVYDKATTFLDNLAFPNGIHCWRGGVIITMAPEIFYAEDTDGDGKADVRKTLYKGFTEGNQQHRVNGLRWGLDGWLYLANGDSGGVVQCVNRVLPPGADWTSYPLLTADTNLRGRDLRIEPDLGFIDAVSGQTQFGRERDDFGNWFGNNNSNPIWQYVLEDRYVRRNPHAGISQVTAPVAVVPGAAPVYPTSRTLARFNDFAFANRFTSACSTIIYRDNYLGDQYYGNAFTSEPVHNLVSRLVMTRDGYGFKGERAADEQQSEFLASSDNWFRPTMIRTGPDGAIWVADMYRAVIEHPEWIPPEYQRKMNLYAGSDMGRIYRIVPASECCGEKVAVSVRRDEPSAAPHDSGTPVPDTDTSRKDEAALADEAKTTRLISAERDGYFEQPWNEIPIEDLVKRLESPNGWWRDTTHRILTHRWTELSRNNVAHMVLVATGDSASSAVRGQLGAFLADLFAMPEARIAEWGSRMQPSAILTDKDPQVRRIGILMLERSLADETNPDLKEFVEAKSTTDADLGVRLQLILTLGQLGGEQSARMLAQMLFDNFSDETLRNAALSSLQPDHMPYVLEEFAKPRPEPFDERLPGLLLAQAAAMKQTSAILKPLAAYLRSVDVAGKVERVTAVTRLLQTLQTSGMIEAIQSDEIIDALGDLEMAAANAALSQELSIETRVAAIQLIATILPIRSGDYITPLDLVDPDDPSPIQAAGIELAASPFFDAKGENQYADAVLGGWNYYLPSVRESAISKYLQREITTEILLDALESGTVSVNDFGAVPRDQLIHHRNESIAARAKNLFDVSANTARSAVVEDFRSQISNLKSGISEDEQAAAGKLVFEKRCATCHRLQDIGKEVGADLSALKDRSTDALLTAILDPNKAVESKFLVYAVVTKDGLQHSGMLKGETGGSLTLIGNDGKEITVVRADIEELVGSQRSLMPEGLEKDLSATDLASVIAFVQSTGTAWNRFEGNAPKFIAANADGSVTLPASAAEIYGPSLIFEEKYSNLGYWTSADDYARWTFEVPKSGHWTVEFDFACDDSNAGSLIKFSTGNRMLTARVPGSGTWDNYQTWQAGTIDLHRGRGQLIITAPEKPPFALIDLRAVRLIPPK